MKTDANFLSGGQRQALTLWQPGSSKDFALNGAIQLR